MSAACGQVFRRGLLLHCKFLSHCRQPSIISTVCPRMISYTRVEPNPNVFADAKCPDYSEVEEVKGHWHWVERLIPVATVPAPPTKDPSSRFPSGWKPPAEKAPDLPYFVGRTRNHMLPVYLRKEIRGPRFLTTVKRVEGEIWQLELELRKYLEQKHEKMILSQVHEFVGLLRFKGDYVEDVKNWLMEKGF